MLVLLVAALRVVGVDVSVTGSVGVWDHVDAEEPRGLGCVRGVALVVVVA